MARQLTETAVDLILNHIKNNISDSLQDVRTYRNDPIVTTEPPPTQSYFIYPESHGYRCPAIFVVDDGTDFRQQETKANFINALMSINVTVKVEDKDKFKLTKKALRYQAALHEILDLTSIVKSDNTVKIVLRVKRIKPSGLYTFSNDEKDTNASFFFEYMLNLEVEYFENF